MGPVQPAPSNGRARRLTAAELWLLVAALLLAFALRVHRLDAQSLWYDEAVTAQVVAQGIAGLTRWTAEDIQPPLYYYVVAGWTRLVGGRSEWLLRFPSVFFGTLMVPLLWVLARRLFGGGLAGRIASAVATWLAALSPLYIYYAQEARMYTLLTFLGAAAGYALLKAVDTGRARGAPENAIGRSAKPPRGAQHATRWWVAFVLAATAMLYTHYFGAFLLAAYGLCFLAYWARAATGAWRTGGAVFRPAPWRDLAAAALSGLAVCLLYLPWLPAMWDRYRVDRSYWQGSLKLDEALRHVAISFTTGAPETMLEADAVRLLPWFGLAFGVAVAALVWAWANICPTAARVGFAPAGSRDGAAPGPHGMAGRGVRAGGGAGERAGLVYLLTCLLVYLLAVLVLASRTPKFNARYLMMVSPAYVLILAGGISALLGSRVPGLARERIAGDGRGQNATSAGRVSAPHYALRIAFSVLRFTCALALIGFLVATSLIAVGNWFTDPAFTKAQWRELVATVRAEMMPGEAVLLVSGHAWPAWDYYAPDIPRARLPDIDILDVDAVLGFDAGASLEQALAGRPGVWLVLWQAEAVDPVGFVPYFLDRAGAEEPISRQFWHLGLRHWWLRPDAAFPTGPRPAHADSANYAHQIALLGWDDPQNNQIIVYWRALNPIGRDYRVSLVLEDALGREVGRWDGRPAGYDYPTQRWRPGEALFGRYPLPLPTGAAAGEYSVTLALYDDLDPAGLDIMDVADNPAGKRARLGPFRVTG